jgi:soluble P-type ATPase
MEIEIPGWGRLSVKNLVLDFTGTLSVDGVLIHGVRERLKDLAQNMTIHVLTADTFGRAAQELEGLPVEITILKAHAEDRSKEDYVIALGADQVVAMGNGNNDALMLSIAALGVAVMEDEGCSIQALVNADLVVKSIRDGLDLLAKPLRIKAGLRR